MMRSHGHICVSYDTLEAAGIPSRTIRTGVSRRRKGWAKPHPSASCVIYDQLRPRYKAALAQHYGIDPLKWLEREELRQSGQLKARQREALEQHLWELREDGYQKYVEDFHDAGAPTDRLTEFARAAAILAFSMSYKKGLFEFKTPKTFKTMIADILGDWKADGDEVKYLAVSSYQTLQARIRKAKKQGMVQAIWTKRGAATKFGEKYVRMAAGYYVMGQKLSYDAVHTLMMKECAQKGWECPSLAWVRMTLQRPEVRNRLMTHREGKKANSDRLLTYVPRERAKAPNTIWQIDGTPLDFYYRTEDGSVARQVMIKVLDMHSMRIIGFTLCDAESRFAMMDALHHATKVTGHLPRQILHDNASAFNPSEMQRLKDKTNRYGCTWRAAAVGNAQDKGQAEQNFKGLPSIAGKLWLNYVGQGIKTLERDGKINPDKLDPSQFPNLLQYRDQVVRMVQMYNSHRVRNRPSPLENYNATPSHGRALDPFQIAELFWPETLTTPRRGYATIEYKKQKYLFEIPTAEAHFLTNEQQLVARYDPEDLQEIHLFQPVTEKYVCSCPIAQKVDPLHPNRSILQKVKSRNEEIQHQQERYMNGIAAMWDEERLRGFNPAETSKETLQGAEFDATIGLHFRQQHQTATVDSRPHDTLNKRIAENRHTSITDYYRAKKNRN